MRSCRCRVVRMSRICIGTGVAMALAWATPAALEAQTLSGRVLDGTSQQQLAGARMQLLAPDGSPIGDPVESAADGSFMLTAPGPDSYYLRVELLSYETLVDGIFEFEETGALLPVTVYLRRRPIEVEGVDVRVEAVRIRRHLRAAGFYERAAAGFGDFLGPEQIEARMASHPTDYFRTIPGVLFQDGIMKFRIPHPFRGPCEPNVWVDGMLVLSGQSMVNTPELRLLENYVTASDIAAIEVYRRASSTPLQWGGGNGSCATILIWTRSGRVSR